MAPSSRWVFAGTLTCSKSFDSSIYWAQSEDGLSCQASSFSLWLGVELYYMEPEECEQKNGMFATSSSAREICVQSLYFLHRC